MNDRRRTHLSEFNTHHRCMIGGGRGHLQSNRIDVRSPDQASMGGCECDRPLRVERLGRREEGIHQPRCMVDPTMEPKAPLRCVHGHGKRNLPRRVGRDVPLQGGEGRGIHRDGLRDAPGNRETVNVRTFRSQLKLMMS